VDIRAIGMGLAFAFIWSSAFTSARVIVADASPLAALAVRFLIAGVVGVAVARAMGQTWRLTPRQWRAVVVFGLCQNAVYLGLNFVAMQTVQASFAAIIASLMPLLVAGAGWVVFAERPSLLAVAGLCLGVVGVALIMGSRLSAGVDLYGGILCVVGVVALTIATLVVRDVSDSKNLMMIVGMQMFVGAAVLGVASLWLEPFKLRLTWSLMIAFTYSTLVAGLLATWFWFALVRRIGAVRAAAFHFLNPIFGVAIATIVLNERLGVVDALGVVIVTLGILAVQMARIR